MTVQKYLELSTAHLEYETANRWVLGDSPFVIALGRFMFGFFITVPSEREIARDISNKNSSSPIPPDLLACINYARERGCEIIHFDRDARVVEGLQTYDW